MKTIIQVAINEYTVNIALVFLSDRLLLGDDGPLQLFPKQQLLE